MDELSDWGAAPAEREPARVSGVESRSDAGTASADWAGTHRSVVQELVSAVPDPAVVVDGDLSVVATNPQFTAQFDRHAATFRGAKLGGLFPALTRDRVVENCDAGAGEHVTTPFAGGGPDHEGRTWVDIGFGRHRRDGQTYFVGVARDVTGRRERERELERYERTLETVKDGVYVLDDSFAIERVNSAFESITGYEASELVGKPATRLADEAAVDEVARLSKELLAGEREVGTLTMELRTASGGWVPVEIRFSAYRGADGAYRQVGVVRDISDRRQFERTLATLHGSTRELLEAQTGTEVCRLVVDSVTDALDVEGAAVYRFEQAENRLVPAAVSGELSGRAAAPVEADDGPLWDAFVGDERRQVPADGEGGTREAGVCFPLGTHGVLYVSLGAERQCRQALGVVEVIAANTEAALARVDREQALRDRDEKLSERNRRLRRLEAVNAIIRRIDRALVDADTRGEVEQAVCEGLAGSELVSLAWVGRPDGDTLDTRAWAGEGSDYLDTLGLGTAGEGGPPAVRTAHEGEMTAVPAVASGLGEEEWRSEALSRGFQSALSVPLRYGEFTYGVLTVYADEQSAFVEPLQSVLAELAETAARAICEVQSRRQRSGATAVELDVALTAPTAPLQRLADCLGARVECDGVVPDEARTARLFVRTVADTETVRECCTGLTQVRSVNAVDDGNRYEVVVAGETVAGTLLERGVRVRTLTATGSDLTATVELPDGLGVRGLVEYLDALYGSAELTARRERAGADRSERVRGAATERLTDRQRQVLRTAYFSGFFEWPRETTGQELAAKFDISQPTISRHIRKGTRRVLDLVFETV